MFEFQLLENEKILVVSNDSLLKYYDNVEAVSVVITNFRFLIFNFPKNVEAFRFGKMLDTFRMSKKEKILEIDINNIDKIIEEKNFDRYILKDTNYFYLCDDNIKKFVLDIINI